MMLGFLLARAGVDVWVLEKHADFLRDFRGDTIHPSTLEVMHELGLLDEFLQRPHQEVPQLTGQIGDVSLIIANFSHLPTRCKFIALMPQWDFLTFLVQQAQRYPTFHLKMEAEVTGLLEREGQVVGVEATTPSGPLQIEAELTVGADGRNSIVRQRAGLEVEDLGAPIDVLWMQLSKLAGDRNQTLGRIVAGRIFVMIDRGDYWQCAYVIRKGGIEEVRKKGLAAFRSDIVALAPDLKGRVEELRDWNDIKLLTVRVDRLKTWYRPGVLCIGDAAHAMSPVGGVGINLAIQDAVAAANILAGPLRGGTLTSSDLKAVQKRREFPTRLIQRAQVFIQTRVMGSVLANTGQPIPLPRVLKMVRRWPWLRRIPAYFVGVGVRPEHVQAPAAVPESLLRSEQPVGHPR
jgi:2-polyprenyl-6-methoxyphenol hydroxylase-like FAD-dependent oxidoreductase